MHNTCEFKRDKNASNPIYFVPFITNYPVHKYIFSFFLFYFSMKITLSFQASRIIFQSNDKFEFCSSAIWRLRNFFFDRIVLCNMLMPTDNERGSGTSIPLGCHQIKTGWLTLIFELQCSQGIVKVIKISRISWPVSFIGYNLYIWVLLPICPRHSEI